MSYGGAVLGYLAVNAFGAALLGSDFGYFVLAMTLATLLGQLGLMGVHRGGLRDAARMTDGDPAVLGDLRRGVRAVSLLLLPAISLATTAVSYLILVTSQSDTDRLAVAAGMGALVYLGGQQKLWANYLRGFGQVRFASLLEGRSGGVLASACQGVLLGLLLMLRPESGLAEALAALAVGYAIPVVVAWRRVHAVWRDVSVHGSVMRDLIVAVRRYWRFASNLLSGLLNSTAEIYLAAAILIAADASAFSAAQRLSILLVVPMVSLGVVFSPVVSRLVGRDDRTLEVLLRTGATIAVSVTALAWIPMLIVPEQLLRAIYPDQFAAAAAPVLTLLTLSSLATVLSGLCGTALAMSRHENIVGLVQWIAVVVRVPLGAGAAYAFGATGLAASAAAVTACLYATLWLVARRRMGLWTHPTLRPNLKQLRQTSG